MTMKFLSGLVSGQESQMVINLFWNAIISSSNRIIKIGGKRQVELLMHLLSQTSINGEIDSRIPSKITKHVDDTILENIYEWEEVLTTTHYSSKPIVNELINRLNCDNDEDVIRSMRILSNLKMNIENRDVTLTFIKEKLQSTDIEVEEAAIYSLSNLINEDGVMDAHLFKLDSKDERILIVTLEVIGDKILPKLFEKLNHHNSWVIIAAIEAIENIDISSPKVIDALINKLSYVGFNSELIVESTLKALKNLDPRNSRHSLLHNFVNEIEHPTDVKELEKAIDIFGNIATIDDPVIDAMLKKFNTTLFSITAYLSTKIKLLKALVNILIRTGKKDNAIDFDGIEKRIMQLCINKLENENNFEMKKCVLDLISMLVKSSPELLVLNFVEAVVGRVFDKQEKIAVSATAIVGEIAISRGDLINKDTVATIHAKSTLSYDLALPFFGATLLNKASSIALAKIAKSHPRLLKTSMKDIKRNNCWKFKVAVCDALCEAAKSKPNLLDINLIKEISDNLCDENPYVRLVLMRFVK